MAPDPSVEVVRKEAFDRDKTCYEQNFQQYRAMNQIMWQVPLLAITITGGLWYAALNVTGAADFRRPLFLLSAVLDFALIAVLWRVRFVMAAYLIQIERFNPAAFVRASGKGFLNWPYTVVTAFSLALGCAGVGSVLGLLDINWLKF
ncbi:hypothetical protein NKI86_03105 [Mesorhizobium sp. M0320]|uniref:hypothetical protein n=1 Tax=unclassified Mesorhizobium TaxID=325217 RepID=UPI00333A496E